MKLFRFTFIHPEGKDLRNVNIKFQYFFHYWSLITSKHNRILLDINKFESHKTLLEKGLAIVKSDHKKRSEKKFSKLFSKHEYFESDNIILKRLSIKDEIQKTRIRDYRNNRTEIISELEYYYDYITNKIDYTKHIYKNLQKAIATNKSPSEDVFRQIRFLINSYIVELYDAGYSLEFISKIPDIITFNDVLNEFPYEKSRRDFDFDETEYKNYKSSQKRTLNLFISGLSNLIKRETLTAFVIFKVFNLVYDSEESLEVNQCIIYNPTRLKFVEEIKQSSHIHEIEQFFDLTQDADSLFKSRSQCNIIVPINLHYPLRNVEKRRQFLDAKNRAEKSLNLFAYEYNLKKIESIKITNTHYFIVNQDFKIQTYGFDIFHELSNIVVKFDDEVDIYYREFINQINKLNPKIDLHKKLQDIIDAQNDLKIDSQYFNFSKLWIAWEALVDKNQLKSIFKLCVNKRYERSFVFDVIKLLNSYLSEYLPGVKRKNLKISEHKLKKYGINLNHRKPLSNKKFLNNYEALFAEVNIPFLNIIKSQLDDYTNKNQIFRNKLDKWIDDIIEEFNNERNLEVHQNRISEYSILKLKTDVLFLSEISSKIIIFNINSRNKRDLNSIKRRIRASP